MQSDFLQRDNSKDRHLVTVTNKTGKDGTEKTDELAKNESAQEVKTIRLFGFAVGGCFYGLRGDYNAFLAAAFLF